MNQRNSAASHLRCALYVATAVCAVVASSWLSAAGSLDGAAHADAVITTAEISAAKAKVDAKDVYFGDGASFKKPAQLDCDAVYAEIPEYKKILDDELETTDPKYQLLMSKASKRFVSAVRKVARADGYDLVVRSGSLDQKDVPDVTQSVIDRL